MNFPDDLNEWSKENFEKAANIFGRTIERNCKAFDKASQKIEKPVTDRETVIGKDDLINLQILLGQTQNIDDFIKNM